MGAIPSVPSRFSVLLLSCLLQKCHPVSHAAPFKRNTPTPLSFLSLSPRQTGVVEKKTDGGRSHLCQVVSVCSSHLVCSTHLVDKTWRPRASTIPSVCYVGSVNVLCVFFLSLVQTRSHLCHVVSRCSSHLVCSTHLVDKRGALEQERISLYHLGLVKVLCVCFFLSLEQHDPICAMSVQCVPPILFAPHISRTSVVPSSKNDPLFAMSVQLKCCVCFS